MKANNGSGNNKTRDEWETPKWFFRKLKYQYKFNFDCCATNKNKKCLMYSKHFEITKSISGGIYWMNPPFSRAYEMFRHFFKVVKKGIAIYRCDNFETKIWQEVIFPKASWIFISNKRIAYEGFEKISPRFPSALIGFNVDPPKGLDGTLLIPNA